MPLVIPLGANAKTYILPTGTRAAWTATATNGVFVGAAPTGLSEVSAVKNAKLTMTPKEADTSTRAGAPWELGTAALISASVDFDIPWQPTDANFTLLLQAFMQQLSVAMAVLDGPKATAGSQGLWADYTILDFSRNEQIADAIMATVKIKPTNSAVPPQWVQVGTGG